MLTDQRRLRSRLRGLLDGGRTDPEGVERAREALRASVSRRGARRASRPDIAYPDDLPVSQKRGEIARAILANQVVVVCGETGSGKTTQLPKICLELGGGIAGCIGHTQPRRIAARSVAARIAHELSTPLGGVVGYAIRFGDKTSEGTLVKVMTDGILLAETARDRLLERYDTLIIDEAHERSLNIDFLLGYVKQLLPRRPDLKVIVTSATIDPERFARHFAGPKGPAPIVRVSGRAYPVEVVYRAHHEDEDLHDDEPGSSPGAEIEDGMVAAVVRGVDECAARGEGGILVFLPGEREIREAARALARHHVPGAHGAGGPGRSGGGSASILPLYSRLSSEEQDRIFQSHAGRRIVLATNVAETSLTVPGIRYVVDTGLARISRYAPRTKVQRLEVEAISRASAAQRAGRCGRVGPGVCVRLYSEQDFTGREEFTDPEILRSNLASVILRMKALELGPIEEFPFVEAPDSRLVKDGYETLRELGAIDEGGALTPTGRALARLPVDPRIARMILEGDKEHCLAEVLVIAAALSSQDARVRPHDEQAAADAAHQAFRDEASDFLGMLKLWRFAEEQREKLSRSKFEKACRQNFLSFLRLREWADVHQQLRTLVAEMGMRERPGGVGVPRAGSTLADAIHRSVLAGLLSSVGKRSEAPPGSEAAQAGDYAGAHGTRFAIFPGSGVARAKPKWVVGAELVRTTRLFARHAASIQPEWIEGVGAHLLTRSHSDPYYDEETQRVMALERTTLFGLAVSEGRRVPFGPVDPRQAREIFIQHALVAGLLRTNAPFFTHNRRLEAQVEAMEDKARRRDLLVDLQSRFDFYDTRVGRDVHSAETLDRWREQAERTDPRVLHMTLDDLLLKDAGSITPEHYPETAVVAGSRLRIDYAMAPGEHDDGVTMSLPLEALNQVDEALAEWLVPGLLAAKIEAILRAIPKSARRAIGPPGEAASAIAGRLTFGEGDLRECVRREVARLAGAELDRALFEGPIPDCYRMNFRVVDERGAELAMGRDLRELRRRLGVKVEKAFGKIGGEAYHRDGITQWDFGDLPERVEVRRNGMAVVAYPALIDQGEGVGLRVVETAQRAAEQTRAGLRRLYALKAHREIRHRLRARAGIDRLAARYAMLAGPGGLTRELEDLVAERAFMGGRGAPRTREEFEGALEAGWPVLGRVVDEVAALAEQVLASYHAVRLALEEFKGAAYTGLVEDVRGQVDALVAPGFLTTTPAEWLTHLPRFLAAARARLAKASGGGLSRDEKLRAEVAPFWNACRARQRLHAEHAVADPELALFRWMVEEFRVSLFAQELRTSVPVSSKRLLEQWEKIGKP